MKTKQEIQELIQRYDELSAQIKALVAERAELAKTVWYYKNKSSGDYAKKFENCVPMQVFGKKRADFTDEERKKYYRMAQQKSREKKQGDSSDD